MAVGKGSLDRVAKAAAGGAAEPAPKAVSDTAKAAAAKPATAKKASVSAPVKPKAKAAGNMIYSVGDRLPEYLL